MRGNPKYAKTYAEIRRCEDCDFRFYYKALRCPMCNCPRLTVARD